MIPLWFWLALAAVGVVSMLWIAVAWACCCMSGMAQRVEYGERGQ